jgi:hypothetical protein
MSSIARSRFEAALDNARRFFMGDADVQRAMHELGRRLEALGVPYAIAGAMALNAYGYERVTKDVDVLLTRDGLERAKRDLLGRGYVEKFAGSRGMRDTVNGVAIDVRIAGDFPGDGKPKPIAFPDPGDVAVRGADIAFLPMATLIELKLASGMTAPHRLKDLADVLELIRANRLPAEFGSGLHAYVRDKFQELWAAAQGGELEE